MKNKAIFLVLLMLIATGCATKNNLSKFNLTGNNLIPANDERALLAIDNIYNKSIKANNKLTADRQQRLKKIKRLELQLSEIENKKALSSDLLQLKYTN